MNILKEFSPIMQMELTLMKREEEHYQESDYQRIGKNLKRNPTFTLKIIFPIENFMITTNRVIVMKIQFEFIKLLC
jgi:hypothetical protein